MADRLVDAARTAREAAYAPYSRFKVGAAIETDDGRIFAGCNVENASYGLTICAERVAVLAAAAAGHRRVAQLAVVAGQGQPAMPCGPCLQVLAEFASDDTPVFLAAADACDKPLRLRLRDLLPHPFRLQP